ncbi:MULTISPECIES: helix-turn-helix domain-containing protein [unclassified Microbacterium]|uniref:helix-turn-helix domain-containing protein n=1 Tax=unclassified Microbacterium TaxID=2609290 RepID=UPI0037C7E04C
MGCVVCWRRTPHHACSGDLRLGKYPSGVIRLRSRAIGIINLKFADPRLCPINLAKKLHVSRRHLSRAFRTCGRIGVSSTISHVRIGAALKIIRERPDLPLRHVSETVGFNDSNTFRNRFKAATGLLPRQYQARVRQPDTRSWVPVVVHIGCERRSVPRVDPRGTLDQ